MIKLTRRIAVIFGLLVVSTAHGDNLPNYNAYDVAPAVSTVGRAHPNAAGTVANPVAGRVAAVDPQRGVPTMFWSDPGKTPQSPHTNPRDAARWYLEHHASLYGLSGAALDAAYVHHVHDTGRGGIIVIFRQRVDGIEVINNELKVLLARSDLALVSITGNLHAKAAATKLRQPPTFRVSASTALAEALGDLYGVNTRAEDMRDLNWSAFGYQHFGLAANSRAQSAQIRLLQPARVKQVYFPMPDQLVPAYFVEFLAMRAGEDEDNGYGYIMAADNGRLLYRQNLKADDAFQYRVWADTEAPFTPLDGPQDDFTPHPTGSPGEPEPAFIAPSLISIEGFNTNPDQLPDPWLPADATETLGNNVDAYADHFAPDGFDPDLGDFRTPISAANTFDYVFDTGQDPVANVTQTQAAIVQLFYVNNWMHNYFYDSGFTEAAGNAQNDNFGRGGIGGDALRAEAQDSHLFARNNANMFTPSDGVAPRMQMFLFNTPDQETSLSLQDQDLAVATAAFGVVEFDLTADVVLADDGSTGPDESGTTSDACEPLTNDVTDAIVLIDRGTCAFLTKGQNAAAAGAAGVIIANNVADEGAIGLAGTDNQRTVRIPVLSTSLEDGTVIKDALIEGAVTVSMNRADTERDGTIDNMIVAHEWGHYIHNRLVRGCGTAQCRGQGEGWADFLALHMSLREGDDLDGTYAVGIYATVNRGDNGYFGVRRAPFSVDPSKNAFTLRHIVAGEPLPDTFPQLAASPDNAEVHNVGEIWTSMLFEGLISMLKRSQGANPPYSFDEAKRRMADYVVAGMLLAPVAPTITEQRDAILAAAFAADPEDMRLMAEGFARRGAGTCAVSAERFSVDMTGTVEDDQLRPNMRVRSIALDDSAQSCNQDGVLDIDETGLVTIEIENPSTLPLIGATVAVSSATTGVVVPDETPVALPDLPPFGTATAEIAIALAEDFATTNALIDLEVTLKHDATCATTVSQVSAQQVNFDLAPAQKDDLEVPALQWQESVIVGRISEVWTRANSLIDTDNHVLHADNQLFATDVAIESPPLKVSADADFVVSFVHRFNFDFFGAPPAPLLLDGGVIELSTDGGDTYQDVETFAVDPGYTGILVDAGINNPLSGRNAYAFLNNAFPDTDQVTLNFGTQFAGQEVRLRFRIGTDDFDISGPALGWEIDDIEFAGLENEPFVQIVETADCNFAPVAAAGSDQTVDSGAKVTLDASASSDQDRDTLTFAWTQTSGTEVALTDSDKATASFTAPTVAEETVLTFAVTVDDSIVTATDSVEITVRPPVDDPDGGPGDGDPDGGPGDGDPDGGPGGGDPDAGPGGGGGSGDGDGGGCGCTVGATQPSGTSAPAVLLFMGLGLVLFRRRFAR